MIEMTRTGTNARLEPRRELFRGLDWRAGVFLVRIRGFSRLAQSWCGQARLRHGAMSQCCGPIPQTEFLPATRKNSFPVGMATVSPVEPLCAIPVTVLKAPFVVVSSNTT